MTATDYAGSSYLVKWQEKLSVKLVHKAQVHEKNPS